MSALAVSCDALHAPASCLGAAGEASTCQSSTLRASRCWLPCRSAPSLFASCHQLCADDQVLLKPTIISLQQAFGVLDEASRE
eukprot:360734-Chlamydomonas_euryale.AAC.3